VNIAICDDNVQEADDIRSYLLAYFDQNGYIGNTFMYDSGEALLADFCPGRFDVLFLDIYMEGISGVDAAARIRESDESCLLVFITSSATHMRDAFALRAASYVEKPVTSEKLEVAFAQCRNIFMKQARFVEFTLLQRGFKVPFNRLVYAESSGRSVFFHTDVGEVFEAHMKMDEVAAQLAGLPALRSHQSFIVNMNYIADVRGNDLVLKDGQLVPIHKSGRKEVVSELNRFMTERLFEGA